MKLLIIVSFFLCICVGYAYATTAEERKLAQLLPAYQSSASAFITWIRSTFPNYKLVVAEVYRTQKRQDELFKKGKHVTAVRVSKHTMRKAMDLYFVNDGRILPFKMAPYAEIGAEWIRYGNIWGGSWKVPFDPGHFEWE